MKSSYFEQASVDELISLKTNLNELIGEGWKEAVFSNSLQELMNKYVEDANIKAFTSTEFSSQVQLLSKLLSEHRPGTRIDVAEDTNNKKTLIISTIIEGDSISMLVDPEQVSLFSTIYQESQGITFVTKAIVLGGKKGYMDLTEAVTRKKDHEVELTFKLTETDKFNSIDKGESTAGKREDGTRYERKISPFPKTIEDFFVEMHEIGHSLRRVAQNKLDPVTQLISHEAVNAFESGVKSGKLRNTDVRQLTVNDERTAWAIAKSLLREAHKSIGLNMGSLQNMARVKPFEQSKLSTYQDILYLHDKKTEQYPSFTDEQRLAARKLVEKVKQLRVVTLADIPLFWNGEVISNKPDRILTLIDTDMDFFRKMVANSKERIQKEENDILLNINEMLRSSGISAEMIPSTNAMGEAHNYEPAKIAQMLSSEHYLDLVWRRVDEILKGYGKTRADLPNFDTQNGKQLKENALNTFNYLVKNASTPSNIFDF